MERAASGRFATAALLGLAGLLVAVRVAGLGQYPLAHPDEGFWACGSRNVVLYADGLLDGRLHPFLSPATFVLLAGWFLAVPPDLVTARAFSVAAGLGACLLLALLARRETPGRAWLVAFLFGLSSLSVLPHRLILLEAHQTFWLVLAAFAWLRPGRWAAGAAGLAFGMALLVKSNSIYLLPAFLLTPPPAVSVRERFLLVGLFLAACVLLGGGGYLGAYGLYPAEFVTAFHYELEGRRFADEGVIFRIGRFGLHPARALATFRQLLVTDAPLVVLAAGGLIVVVRRRRAAGRADRFFAAWLALGVAFVFGQIYVEHRYLATVAPPLAWLGARPLAVLLERGAAGWAKAGVAAVLVAFALFHAGRVGAGVARRGNAGYWEVVGWMRGNAPRGDRVLAAPVINLSLPQQGHDFFRLLVPYDGPRRPAREVVEEFRIRWIIVDPEWREYETPDLRVYLSSCARRAAIGDTTIYEAPPP
jgi:4-amino-4-deoxy-L-arabinose transferase-like glycosyltransferase